MGLWSDIRTYLRVGAPAVSTPETRALQKYSSFETLAPSWAITNQQAYVVEAHRRNALAYACIEYMARSVATPILEAVRETSDGYEELPPLDPLTRLLSRPSEDYPSQTRFIRQLVRHLMLTGECIMYKAPGERTGQVRDLQMLPSSKVAVERDTTGRKTYLYYYDPALPPMRLKAEEVLFLKFDDVLDKDRGLAPLAAAARETDVDNATADIRKTFFQEGAILEGILTTEQQANEKQLKEWAAMWKARYGGPKNAGKTAALAGGLSYQQVGATPDKWAFKEVTGLSEARICSAFGVPPILVGAKIGLDRSTYSNYQEARRAFWEDTVSPLLVFLADEFTDSLTDTGDARLCRWNTDEVPALQEDADSREQRAGRSLEKGAVTINEYREAAGLDPVEDGDAYMLPSGYTIVPVGELQAARTPETLKPSEADQEGEEDEGEPEEPEEEPRAEYGEVEHRLARDIEGVFGTQANAVAEKVGSTLDPDELLDLTVEAERMAEAITPHLRAILEDTDLDTTTLALGYEMATATRDLIASGIADLPEDWSSERAAQHLREVIADRGRAEMAATQALSVGLAHGT